MEDGMSNKNGEFCCPRCNCRIVYDFENAKIPIAILQQNHDGDGYFAEQIAADGRIMKDHYRCADCHFEFNDPVWISAECYEGK
jgi:hypothetical protein